MCDILADRLAEVGRVGTEVDTSSPYYGQDGEKYNVFSKETTRAGKEFIACSRGFSRYFGVPASEGGQYPTRQDLNNIFHIGVDHGKMRTFGMPNLWSPIVNEILEGYPYKSIVYDDNGNRFISKADGNKNPLPKEGETSKTWVPIKPIPSFMRKTSLETPKWNRIDFNPYHFKLDVQLPLESATTKMMVRKFTGEELGFSGIMFFADALYISGLSNKCPNIASIEPPYTSEEGVTTKSSFSMKLSPYPDIYDNEEHSESFIEVLSRSKYYNKPKGKNVNYEWEYRSQHKMVPISLHTTYYLYMEFENACISDPFLSIRDGAAYDILTYNFPRTLCWPLTNP